MYSPDDEREINYKKAKKVEKPFIIECRWTRWMSGTRWDKWHKYRAYRTEKQRNEALKSLLAKKHSFIEFRIPNDPDSTDINASQQ